MSCSSSNLPARHQPTLAHLAPQALLSSARCRLSRHEPRETAPDSKFIDEEYLYILGIAGALHVGELQVDAIRSVQENLAKLKDIPPTSEAARKIAREGAATLASVGVPTIAVAVSGAVFRLSADGITSGLAALGALVGGGMLAGAVLVVPAIAISSGYGVKKLFGRVWSGTKME